MIVVQVTTCRTMRTELRESMVQWRKDCPVKDTEYVFVCLDHIPTNDHFYGKPFTKRQHFMKRACEKAGVKPFGFHAIRHLTATTLYHKGYSESEIQAILRHKSPTTTNRYLKTIGLEHTRKALEYGLKKECSEDTKTPSENGVSEGIDDEIPVWYPPLVSEISTDTEMPVND